jgi:hypothetical protein
MLLSPSSSPPTSAAPAPPERCRRRYHPNLIHFTTQ